MNKILVLAKEAYEKYERTLEEDEKLLEKEDLTFNIRNCLLYTQGEKKILLFLIRSCQKILPLLDMDFKVKTYYKYSLSLHFILDSKKERLGRPRNGALQGLSQQRNILPNKEG